MDSMDTNPVAGDTVVEMDNIQTVADEIVATDGGGEVVVTDGGDEIVATDGGDDVVATDGGNEVVATDGGDEVVATDGGDEVVATDGGDEVVASDGGDEIVAADGGDAEGQLQKEIMAAVSESAPDRCNEVAVSYDPAQTTYIFTFVDSNMTSQEVTPTITTAVNQTISSLDAAEVLVVAAESATDLEEAVLEQVEGKSPIETQTVEDKSTNETQTESESVNQSVTETAEPDLNVETISYIEKKPEYVNEGSDEKLKPESNGPLAQKITEHSPGFQSISNTLEVKTASESDSNMVMVPPEVIEQADEVIKTLQSIITPKDIGKKRKRMSEFKEHGISQTDSLRNTEVEVFESTKTKKSLENEGKKSKSGKKCVVIAKNSIPVRNKRKTKKPQRLLDSETETELETTSKEKPKIITLPTVTKLNLGFQDLYIEVEIEDELFVSSLNKQPLCNGKTKYSFRISNHETESSLVEETSCASEKGPNKLRTRGKQLHSDKETKQSQLTGTAKKLKVKKGRPRKKIKLEACEIEKEVSDVDLKLDGTSEIIETLVEMSDENADKKIEINIASSHEYTECLKLEASVNNLSGIIDSNVEIDDGKSDNYDEEDAGMEADAEIDDVKKSVKLPKKRKQKRVKEEVASETEKEKPIKEKRKYTRRNAYSSSDRDNNYTVKKQDSGKKIYLCNICEKQCVSAANVIDHMCIHTSDRPNTCSDCNLNFKSEKALKRHSVRHKKKSVICDTCGAFFCSRSDLKSHASVHTNERQYVCDKCGQGFNHSTTLSRHKQTHRQERNIHVCHVCGATFPRKDGVKRHIKNIHGIDEKPEKPRPKMDHWFRNKRSSQSLRKCQHSGNNTDIQTDCDTSEVDGIKHTSSGDNPAITPSSIYENACSTNTFAKDARKENEIKPVAYYSLNTVNANSQTNIVHITSNFIIPKEESGYHRNENQGPSTTSMSTQADQQYEQQQHQLTVSGGLTQYNNNDRHRSEHQPRVDEYQNSHHQPVHQQQQLLNHQEHHQHQQHQQQHSQSVVMQNQDSPINLGLQRGYEGNRDVAQVMPHYYY